MLSFCISNWHMNETDWCARICICVILLEKKNKLFFDDYIQTVVDMCTSSLRALIAAYGWMLSREAEMVSE